MKCFKNLVIASSLLAPWVQTHAIELSDEFNLELKASLLSDYRTRGISQTQNDPALQGEATLIHNSGLYAGIWSSNVDFGYGSRTRQEVDYYAGYWWQMSDDVALDIGYIKYAYPRQSDFNASETYAILHAYGLLAGVQYSSDLYGNQSALYSYVGYGTILPYDIGLDMRYGLNDLKDPLFISASGHNRNSYHEWEVKVNRTFLDLNWALSYVDTNLSDAECLNYMGFDDVCSATVVASVKKTF